MPSGGDNVLTIHTNDGVERFRVDSSGNVKVGSACTISPDGDVFFTGVCTATTLAGSGANLTNLPAANLTGALPAISGANLTGIAATDNVRTGILDVAGISTFRNTMNVGAAVTISESGIEATGVGITVANINGGQVSGRRNKIINGAMLVDQRNAGSSTNIANGSAQYHLDRWSTQAAGLDEASIGVAQSTDCPDGFAHSMKLTVNTPESSIASSEYISVYQKMEGQDLQDLAYGVSGAKNFTMSFYVKSSITGTFSFTVYRDESTDRIINKTYTINSANTWERKTINIAGDTTNSITNDNTARWWNVWHLAAGSNYDSVTSSTWENYSTTNWAGGHAQDGVITTNGATWAITGVQLETGSQATEFEHRSFGEELALCQRYFYKVIGDSGDHTGIMGYFTQAAESRVGIHVPVSMRTAPTYAGSGTGNMDSAPDSVDFSLSANTNTIDAQTTTPCPDSFQLQCIHSGGSNVGGHGCGLRFRSSGAFISLSAEL